MRAFLSHSSKNKGFVNEVASLLRPGSYELDSETFERGLLNAHAVERALLITDLFVLFLSEDSVHSGYVQFETLIAQELFASGAVERILVICLDAASFEAAAPSLRFHNMVRKVGDAASTARLITSVQLTVARRAGIYSHPFLNREAEIAELQDQLFDHARPPARALFISGNQGSGRHALCRKIYTDQYHHVVQPFPEIEIGQYDGLDEIHRKILTALRPSLKARELATIEAGFSISGSEEKARQIAQLINSLLPNREAIIVSDTGGLITDDGGFQPFINEIIDNVDCDPHPPLVIISLRMVRHKYRRAKNDVAYCGVKAFTYDVSRRLITALTKSNSIIAEKNQLDRLTELGEDHCYNYYRMIEDIRSKSLDVFLATANEFVEWKHKRSSDYIKRLFFSESERMVVSVLNLVPQADFDAIFAAAGIDRELLGSAIDKLIHEHVVEFSTDLYRLSPALRVAIERDRRFALSNDARQRALSAISERLSVRLEEGTAALQLVDAAILAEIESSSALTSFTQALVLPSHYVWLAQRSYDRQDFPDSVRLARSALDSKSRLSRNGMVAACRYLCLGAARIGDEPAFAEGMAALRTTSSDKWARTNIEFLLGFNERLKGNLPLAETHFREALKNSDDNFSAARELAAVCAARNNLEDAELYARIAQKSAPDNPYIIDILISILIRRYGRQAKYDSEINTLFDALERVGDEGGRSFYTTRKAEFEHLWGNNGEALRLIERAAKATPRIFDVRRLRAQILLKDGNTGEAWKEIEKLKEIVEVHSSSDRRSNYRLYVDAYAEYLETTGNYMGARQLYDGNSAFTAAEREARIKEIDMAEAYSKRR